jgi:UDP-N-acetylglucosamine acyltransferase
MSIHYTALVDKDACIEEGVDIGPYAVIGKNVTLKSGTQVGPHVVIDGWTTIGRDCKIYVGAVIGLEPQDMSFKGGRSYVQVGDRNTIREYVTIHRGVEEETATVIGDDNLIMANAHVAHNCRIGNKVIIVNYVGISGHVTIEDRAFISLSGIHQFIRIGSIAMVGGGSKVVKDVPPYVMVDGHPARAIGLNVVGLRRAGVPLKVRNDLKRAYYLLYSSKLNITQAIEAIREEVEHSPQVDHLVNFLQNPSKRGICGPSRDGKDAPPDEVE